MTDEPDLGKGDPLPVAAFANEEGVWLVHAYRETSGFVDAREDTPDWAGDDPRPVPVTTWLQFHTRNGRLRLERHGQIGHAPPRGGCCIRYGYADADERAT